MNKISNYIENDLNNQKKIFKDNYIFDNDKNYIISETKISNDNQKIRIINSYDQYCREKKIEMNEIFINEKEIKENITIKINNKNIPFSYFYSFNKKGNYTIKYIFKKNLTKTNFMFCECLNLTNIDLSKFNTEYIVNTSCMFYDCESLKYINLSNINTSKVSFMSSMFSGCKSLAHIDLSHFQTQNVTDMDFMFFGCKSLVNLNLSKFNTINVKDMANMFSNCENLIQIDLSNFKIRKDTEIKNMFYGCYSLKKNNIFTKEKKILKMF